MAAAWGMEVMAWGMEGEGLVAAGRGLAWGVEGEGGMAWGWVVVP